MDKTTIHPRHDRVLILRDGSEETSKAGIILPASEKDKKKDTGVVVAMGPGSRNPNGSLNPIGLNTGNRVLFNAYAGIDVSDTGDSSLVVIKEEDILAVLSC